MKKILFFASMLYGSIVFAQQVPTGTALSGNANNPNAAVPLANAAWYRGGNFPVGATPPNANIFGTMWNSPIYTSTNGINRTRLNGTLTTLINGVNQNVDGNFGIGRNGYFANNTPRTLFHLQGYFSSG